MGVDEVHAFAEAILEGASIAEVGVTVSFDDGAEQRHVYLNDAAATIFGYTPLELLGAATTTTFAPEERDRIQVLAARWRHGERIASPVETVALRRNGERIPVEIWFSVVPLLGEPAVVMFVRDIRERAAAEEAIRQSERRFRQLIEAAPDAIAVHRDGRFVYVNPAHVALFGRSREELVGHEVGEFLHPDDREATVVAHLGRGEPREEEPRAGAPQPAEELRVLRPDGRSVNVELSSIPIEYEGQPAVLAFARDTTERKVMQARLAFADRMTTLGMLAAGVAHELNNPLAYTALNVESLARQIPAMAALDAADMLSALEAARDGLARMATIVRDLRSFSTPKSEVRWPVDVEEVLESALNMAMFAVRGRARLVRRYMDVPPLKTDPTRLGQILLNLIFNAVQAFEVPDEEKNELVIAIAIATSNRSDVLVTVSDNGPGISKEVLPRIFEPFFTTKSTGTGLGLAICQTLVTSLGGKLEVESEIGRGTRFSLRLPSTTTG